ncbi:MAG: SDR family oxidoreductase [Bacteroidetes bacterium]|nr:MAG: SDR family oxidoreductase [Bacteroidota bacterium]
MFLDQQVVWITGASSGIGEALVYACIDAGARVILSARRLAELERVRDACGEGAKRCLLLPLDLTQPETLREATEQAIAQMGRVDLLINNGGVSQRAYAHETTLEVDRRLMEINYFGHITLTKYVLPHMLEQGGGHIVAVSSITGKFGFPMRSAYSASKHALHGFFETLGLELASRQIYTTVVCPGRVRTQVSVNALTGDGTPHAQMDPGQAQGISAEQCARQILRAVKRRKKEVYIGGKDVIMVYLKRYAPALFYWMARRISAT